MSAPRQSSSDLPVLTRLLSGMDGRSRKRGLSIAKLIDQFLEHARSYYCHSDGRPTSEYNAYRNALRVVRKSFGRTPAEEFRPLKLKKVREEMVAKGWCRKTVNSQVSRVKQMFKWAVENELLSADRYHALQSVGGLRMGRTMAPDRPPVRPAPIELVEGILPYVSVQVAAMIKLQLLTGMRPGEVCIMRTCDIDRTLDVWVYKPAKHKTQHHFHERLVLLGPKAQEVVAPFLLFDEPEAYLFSPAEAEKQRLTKLHETRVTPMSCGNVPGSHRRRRPKVKPGDHYDRTSYTRAISRACEVAFPVPPDLSPEDAAKWKAEHRWHPHQLRHNAATKLRKAHGIDLAQIILGHKTLAVTAIYAERDVEGAMEVMRKEG